jgi:transcriptional regulator with XRE-family HTH domain
VQARRVDREATALGEALAGNMRRLRGGRSVRELARLAGLSAATWSRLERGERTPSVETLARLSAVLGAPAWLLLAPGARERQHEPTDVAWRYLALGREDRRRIAYHVIVRGQAHRLGAFYQTPPTCPDCPLRALEVG